MDKSLMESTMEVEIQEAKSAKRKLEPSTSDETVDTIVETPVDILPFLDSMEFKYVKHMIDYLKDHVVNLSLKVKALEEANALLTQDLTHVKATNSHLTRQVHQSTAKVALAAPKMQTSPTIPLPQVPKGTSYPANSAPRLGSAWTTVPPVKGPKRPQVPTQPMPTRSFRDVVAGAPSIKKVDLLLKKPIQDTEQAQVLSAIATLPFKAKARDTPVQSWKMAVTAITGIKPLGISIINPGTAEIFYSEVDQSAIETIGSKGTISTPNITDLDIPRRAKAYLRGYFGPLRRAAYRGFTKDQARKLLLRAEELLPSMFDSPSLVRQWNRTIAYDRRHLDRPDDTFDSEDLAMWMA